MGFILGVAFGFGALYLLAGLPAEGAVWRIARKHRQALGLKWRQTVHIDEYGEPEFSAWQRECRRFILRFVQPEMWWWSRQWLRGRGWDRAHRIVGEVALAASQSTPIAGVWTGSDPLAYEAFCADVLRRAGWSVALTSTSGDFGVDLIAHRGAFCVVLQAKLWSGSVGVSAVQEIAAGRMHANADRAAVVSNSRYTTAARQLASTNGVLLLHDNQLPELARLCGADALVRVS